MKILSVFILTFFFMLTGCSDGGNGGSKKTDTSMHLKVTSAPANSIVPINQYVVVTFSAAINPATVKASSVYIADENKAPVAAVLLVAKERVSIIPDEFFLPDSVYTVVVTAAVEDIYGRTLENTFTFPFTTSSAPDTLPPSLVSVTPPDGTQAAKTTDIAMEFDEIIAGDGVLQLRDRDTNDVVKGTSAISGNALHFVPDSHLTPGANYTVTLQGTVEDLSGNIYDGLSSWDFSVVPKNDLIPPSLVSVTPPDGTQAAKTTDIAMEFDEIIAGDGVLQLRDRDTNDVVKGTSAISGNALHFVPDSHLTPGANYTVTLQGTVEDLSGNIYDGLSSWDFSVVPASELKVVSVSHRDRVIRVEFSNALDPSTVNESDFSINGGSITFDHLKLINNIVLFIADSNINGTEEISVSGTIKDINGVSHNNGVTAIYNMGYPKQGK